MALRRSVYGVRSVRQCRRLAEVSSHKRQKIKKFYEKVGVEKYGDGHVILLDGRKLKTPLGSHTIVPTEELAYLVAHEWDTQEEHLELTDMHITSLCNTAIDNPSNATPEAMVAALMEYFITDTVLFRQEIPPDLGDMQMDCWDPIISQFEESFNIKCPSTTSIIPCHDSTEAVEHVSKEILLRYQHPWGLHWGLTGLEFATTTSKSMIIANVLLSGKISAEDATKASRLETVFQTNRFGEVEWAHNIDHHSTVVRLASAYLFNKFLN
eukprot:m.11852 g.11852  ORF g.11852 m.11852 type:complete len:268 (-) comp4538_c0_seq1:12-815(-)